MDGRLVAFVGIAIVLIITPGPDMAMVTKNALRHGRRGALFTTAGIGTSILLHATVAALGLSALLRTASTLYTVVRPCGAAYLAYLGVRALWNTRTTRSDNDDAVDAAGRRSMLSYTGSCYRQGMLSALLNPKLVVFFATFLPQFVDPRQDVLRQMLLLGALFDVLGVLWLASYGLLVTRLKAVLGAAQVRRRMERVTGLVLVAFGARLALARS